MTLSLIISAAYLFIIKPRFNKKQIQQTLAIIKPDAIEAHLMGKIIDKIEQEGFKVIDLRKIQLEKEGAEKFYEKDKNTKSFQALVSFMTSGPIVVLILEKENAVQAWKDLMGDTNPSEAKEGTIRKLYGTNIEKNAVHGSDSAEGAMREIRFFFSDYSKI
jgi:nucleoside-diphosphate kinase